jgi:hypothetical protein
LTGIVRLEAGTTFFLSVLWHMLLRALPAVCRATDRERGQVTCARKGAVAVITQDAFECLRTSIFGQAVVVVQRLRQWLTTVPLNPKKLNYFTRPRCNPGHS